MKRYLVSLQGKNLFLRLRGELGKYGFRTKRYIEAKNEEQAERLALRLIFQDRDIQRILRNGEDDPPMVSVEEILEVEKPLDKDHEALKIRYHPENPSDPES